MLDSQISCTTSRRNCDRIVDDPLNLPNWRIAASRIWQLWYISTERYKGARHRRRNGQRMHRTPFLRGFHSSSYFRFASRRVSGRTLRMSFVRDTSQRCRRSQRQRREIVKPRRFHSIRHIRTSMFSRALATHRRKKRSIARAKPFNGSIAISQRRSVCLSRAVFHYLKATADA